MNYGIHIRLSYQSLKRTIHAHWRTTRMQCSCISIVHALCRLNDRDTENIAKCNSVSLFTERARERKKLNRIVKSTVTNSWRPLLLLRANLFFGHILFSSLLLGAHVTRASSHTTDRCTVNDGAQITGEEANVFKSTFQRLEHHWASEWEREREKVTIHSPSIDMCVVVCLLVHAWKKKLFVLTVWGVRERGREWKFFFFIALSVWVDAERKSRKSGCTVRALLFPERGSGIAIYSSKSTYTLW